MNTKILIFFSFTLTIFSCKKDNTNGLSILTTLTGESGLTYNQSQASWLELKNQNGNSYLYQTTFTSWTGFGSTTELKVINGEVVSRIYQEYTIDGGTGNKEITDSYTETSADLGTHTQGAAPLTIDELYESCAADYLTVDENDNTIYFETEGGGLMTLCGFVPNNCADDCFEGIRITAFEWLN